MDSEDDEAVAARRRGGRRPSVTAVGRAAVLVGVLALVGGTLAVLDLRYAQSHSVALIPALSVWWWTFALGTVLVLAGGALWLGSPAVAGRS